MSSYLDFIDSIYKVSGKKVPPLIEILVGEIKGGTISPDTLYCVIRVILVFLERKINCVW